MHIRCRRFSIAQQWTVWNTSWFDWDRKSIIFVCRVMRKVLSVPKSHSRKEFRSNIFRLWLPVRSSEVILVKKDALSFPGAAPSTGWVMFTFSVTPVRRWCRLIGKLYSWEIVSIPWTWYSAAYPQVVQCELSCSDSSVVFQTRFFAFLLAFLSCVISNPHFVETAF